MTNEEILKLFHEKFGEKIDEDTIWHFNSAGIEGLIKFIVNVLEQKDLKHQEELKKIREKCSKWYRVTQEDRSGYEQKIEEIEEVFNKYIK